MAFSNDPRHQRSRNLKLALVLASVAAVFFIGIIARFVLVGH